MTNPFRVQRNVSIDIEIFSWTKDVESFPLPIDLVLSCADVNLHNSAFYVTPQPWKDSIKVPIGKKYEWKVPPMKLNSECKFLVSTQPSSKAELDLVLAFNYTRFNYSYNPQNSMAVDFMRTEKTKWNVNSGYTNVLVYARQQDIIGRLNVSGRFSYPYQLRYDIWELVPLIAAFLIIKKLSSFPFKFLKNRGIVLPKSQKDIGDSIEPLKKSPSWFRSAIVWGILLFYYLVALIFILDWKHSGTLVKNQQKLIHLRQDYGIKKAELSLFKGVNAIYSATEPDVVETPTRLPLSFTFMKRSFPYQDIGLVFPPGRASVKLNLKLSKQVPELFIALYSQVDVFEKMVWSGFFNGTNLEFETGAMVLNGPRLRIGSNYYLDEMTVLDLEIVYTQYSWAFNSDQSVSICGFNCEISQPDNMLLIYGPQSSDTGSYSLKTTKLTSGTVLRNVSVLVLPVALVSVYLWMKKRRV